MKLIKFRIRDYKSIKNSGWCYLASGITILAGKNESGKSATLEALQSFDTEKTIPSDATPIDNYDEKPEIGMCFEVEREILDKISHETDITISNGVRENIFKNGLTVLKFGDNYCFEKTIEDSLNEEKKQSNAPHIRIIKEIVEDLSNIKEFSSLAKPDIHSNDIENIQETVAQYISETRNLISLIPETKIQETSHGFLHLLSEEIVLLDFGNPADEILEKSKQYIPNFIFFSDLFDILPFEIPFEEAKTHSTVQDFAKVANLDLEKAINTSDLQQRTNILNKASAKISGDFMSHWDQDQLYLSVGSDGGHLYFGIKESESENSLLFKPEQRSKGFQWFLSFYLRLNAEQGSRNIILIDEPGLYLHAKAQQDVLKVLERISENSQIILSTHSPYLIDPQHLNRVCIVLKDDKKGTRIENKIHRDADAETLTPIITAIGLDLANDFSIVGQKNVLLEGISDYYFLQALSFYTKVPSPNFIPCTGAPKIHQLVSLLIGWDLPYAVVFDNDKAGRRAAGEIEKKLSVEKNLILFISDEKDFSTEDLFTQEDFNEFVLDEETNENKEVRNSEFLKKNNLDKVLLSKKFFEKIKDPASEIELSQSTVDSFEKVFKKIDEVFLED